MKKVILSIIAITAIAFSANAQIPNNSFENWTNMGNYSDPDMWGTLNSTTNLAGVYTVTQGTPGNPGAYYLKITSKTVLSNVVPGIAATGVINASNQTVTGGFAFTTRPANLTGKWQYMAMSGSDQGSINILLTHWNTMTNSRDTVSATQYLLPGMVMAWANFTIPLTYQSATLFPDTCMIILAASNSTPAANSYLWVDNLTFSGVNSVNENSFLANVSVYPNPSSSNLILDMNFNSAEQTTIELTDLNGKIIRAENAGLLQGEVKYEMNITGIANGNYFIRVITDKGVEVKKVVIE